MLLNVCSLFCGLDFVCALSNMRSSNKNVVLTQRYPKHAVLKSANISATATATISIFCTTHIHWPANLPLQFDPHPLSLLLHTLSNLPQISPFFKNSPFSGRTGKSTFSADPQNTRFQRPRTRRILELQTCKQVFCDLQIL